MFTRFTLSIVAIIMLISLAGCGTTNQTNQTPGGTPANPSNGASNPISDTSSADNYQMLPVISGKVATIKVDASADGTTQQLKKGEVLSITLESNPSTGYAWYATIADTSVAVQMGEPEYASPTESTTPVVGAAGTQTFMFQAIETGTTMITLDYKRAWETDVQPEQTVRLTIEVH